jgi:uncharacterized protein YjbI with pentapeptide repeats
MATPLGQPSAENHHRRGLRKLSPDVIDKAREETSTQVARIGLTFLATTAFCLLSLLSPDSALLGDSEKVNVPLTGPVSFFGFMLLGPAVLIILRIYLQIYVEHSKRLDLLARQLPMNRVPTLVPLKNPLIWVFSGLTFYLLLPVAMLLFAWKAAVFPDWGLGLLCVAAGVIASHAMLPLRRVSWRSRVLLSLSVAFLAGGIFAAIVMRGFEPFRRPFNLFHASLSGQMLAGDDLRGAKLRSANLTGADLHIANLTGAHLGFAKLSGADLTDADLTDADLSWADLIGAQLGSAKLTGAELRYAKLSSAKLIGAKLRSANLTGADLTDASLFADLTDADLTRADLSGAILVGAHLTGAKLSGAHLSRARGLTQTQLTSACGSTETELPEGLTIKPCPETQ